MSRRTDGTNTPRRKSSDTLTAVSDEEYYWQEFGRNEPHALVRFRANQIFHVSFRDGVDVLAARAKALFDSIAPSALTTSAETSDRDVLYKALTMWTAIVQLAVMQGRPDLERIGIAMHAGLVALEERDRGFDEPLLRARQRLRDQPRDAFYVRQLKALAAQACGLLKEYGARDAASQVAKVINRSRFLPPKRNGKSVVSKSVLNWRGRYKYFYWLFRPEMSHFRRASELWREGHGHAARLAVLRELSDRLEEMRRFAWKET